MPEESNLREVSQEWRNYSKDNNYVCPYCGHKQDHGGKCDNCGFEEFGLF